MSTSTLTSADSIFVGRGRRAQMTNFWGRQGVPVHLPTKAVLGTPEVADADYLIKAATGTELPNAETVTYLATATDASPHDAAATTTTIYPAGLAVTAWDVRDGATYGRNLVGVATHDTDVVAMTVLVSGYDYALQPMSQLFDFPAAGTNTTLTATGTKAFAYVTAIAITAAGDAEANTLNLGTGTRLGIPFALASTADVIKAAFGGAEELINVASNATVYAAVTSAATTTSGDVRGTVTFNATLDGTECTFWYYVAGHATAAGIAGVSQA